MLLVVVLTGGATTHELLAAVRERGPAGQGRRRPGRRPRASGTIKTIELTRRQPGARRRHRRRSRSRRCTRARQAIIRATSLSGVANRYIALTPGPQNQPELDDGATLDARRARRRSSTSTSSSTRSTSRRARDLPEGHQGLRDAARGPGRAAPTRPREYFNPVLSTSRRLVEQLTADEEVLTDLLRQRVQGHHRAGRPPRRPDERGLEHRTQTASAIAARVRQPRPARCRSCRRRCAAATPPSSTCAPRSATSTTLVDASKPATKRPGAVPAPPAPAGRRRAPDDRRPAHGSSPRTGPNNDLVDATLKFPRLERASPRPSLRNGRKALRRVRRGRRLLPPVRAGPRRLAARLRPGRLRLRRQRPLRAHRAGRQRLLLHATTPPAALLDGDPGRRPPGPARRRQHGALPGRRDAGRRRRLQRQHRRAAARRRLQARPVPGGPVRRVAHHRRASTALVAAAGVSPAPGEQRRRLPRPRDLRLRGVHRAGRGRQDRRRARSARSSRCSVTPDNKAAVGSRHHRARLPGLPRGRDLRDPPAVADRRAVRRVRADAAARRRRADAARAAGHRGRRRRGPAPAARRADRARASRWT